jgi:hypothetical protein
MKDRLRRALWESGLILAFAVVVGIIANIIRSVPLPL